jgi:hypothetical protein
MGWKRMLGKIVDSISNSCNLGIEDLGTRTNRGLVFTKDISFINAEPRDCPLLPSVYTIILSVLCCRKLRCSVVAVGLSFLDMEYWIGVATLIAGSDESNCAGWY